MMRKVRANRTHPRNAPRAFSTRRVPREEMVQVVVDVAPRAGDLVLARVDRLGHHRRLQLPSGARQTLFEGDEIVVAYADRYAPRQFEATVPPRLEPCHLVAGGGIAARALSWHDRVRRGPTEITPCGLVADACGRPLNVADWALPEQLGSASGRTVTIAVLGTSMDSGKTTMAAYLARGLARAGMRPGYAKLTGTGAGGDLWLAADAGASPAVDFTDAGFASTYRVPLPEVERIARTLLGHLADAGADVAIVEVADGLLQAETAAVVASDWFHTLSDAALFASPDALGAGAGVDRLRAHGVPVLAVGGCLTAAPLQCREAMEATRLPVLRSADLGDPATACKLVDQARECRKAA